MMCYQKLFAMWEDIRGEFSQQEWEHLCGFLREGDDIQVLSNIEYLLSFGDAALCAVLRMEGGNMILDGIVPHHRLLWKVPLVLLTMLLSKLRMAVLSLLKK